MLSNPTRTLQDHGSEQPNSTAQRGSHVAMKPSRISSLGGLRPCCVAFQLHRHWRQFAWRYQNFIRPLPLCDARSQCPQWLGTLLFGSRHPRRRTPTTSFIKSSLRLACPRALSNSCQGLPPKLSHRLLGTVLLQPCTSQEAPLCSRSCGRIL